MGSVKLNHMVQYAVTAGQVQPAREPPPRARRALATPGWLAESTRVGIGRVKSHFVRMWIGLGIAAFVIVLGSSDWWLPQQAFPGAFLISIGRHIPASRVCVRGLPCRGMEGPFRDWHEFVGQIHRAFAGHAMANRGRRTAVVGIAADIFLSPAGDFYPFRPADDSGKRDRGPGALYGPSDLARHHSMRLYSCTHRKCGVDPLADAPSFPRVTRSIGSPGGSR